MTQIHGSISSQLPSAIVFLASSVVIQFRIKYWLLSVAADLNPIEEVFSKVKLVLQDERNDLRVEGGLEEGIERAFASITPEDMRGYFRKVYV